jgi:dnd system-associated protein 4
MNFRVKRPSAYSDILEALKTANGGCFPTIKDILLFSAAYGFENGSRIAFDQTDEPVAGNVFRDYPDTAFIFTLAVAETGDLGYADKAKIKDAVAIFEEYAAGGLKELSEKLDLENVAESLYRLVPAVEDATPIEELKNLW